MKEVTKKDIYRLVKWFELREYNLSIDSETTKEEKDIHYYFKQKYGIRLFETNGDKVLDLIFKNE